MLAKKVLRPALSRKRSGCRRLAIESLESRRLLAADLGHNFVEAEDVNLDGRVTAADANAIVRALSLQQLGQPIGMGASSVQLRDVNQSGTLSPGDALLVINRLAQDARSLSDLEPAIDRLAVGILTESLPEELHPRVGFQWLVNIQSRFAVPSDQQGPFQQLDRNLDSQLTEAELENSIWQTIQSRDQDSDEVVTDQELLRTRASERVAQLPGDGAGTALDRLDYDGDAALSVDEVSTLAWAHLEPADENQDGEVTIVEIGAIRIESELALLLADFQASFDQLDIDDDGQLQLEELTDPTWQSMSRFDVDSSLTITRQEISQLRTLDENAVRGPDPTLSFDLLDVVDDQLLRADELSPEAWQIIESADTNSDSGVSLLELAARRSGLELEVRSTVPGPAFAMLDLDQDNQLQERELTTSTWQLLLRSDTDGSEGVSLEELAATRNQDELALQTLTPDPAFARLDLDVNQRVESFELSDAIWNRLSYADGDLDNALSLAEVLAAREANELALDGQSSDDSARAFSRLDLDEDGFLVEADVSAATWTRIVSVDTDSSQSITFTELDAPRQVELPGPITLGFDTDGVEPDLDNRRISVPVGQATTVHVYVVGSEQDTRVNEFGLLGFGYLATYNTDFGSVTASELNNDLRLFSSNHITTPGTVQQSGSSTRLGVPVSAGDDNHLFLASFTFEASAVGTTTFSFRDLDSRSGLTDFSLGDSEFTSIDDDIFRVGDLPRTLTFVIDSV